MSTTDHDALRDALQEWLNSHGEMDVEERLAEAAKEWLDVRESEARATTPAGLRELRWIVLNGGLQLPGFDHSRERATSKPSDPDDIRWDCSCGYAGSPATVRRHWIAMWAALAASGETEQDR